MGATLPGRKPLPAISIHSLYPSLHPPPPSSTATSHATHNNTTGQSWTRTEMGSEQMLRWALESETRLPLLCSGLTT